MSDITDKLRLEIEAEKIYSAYPSLITDEIVHTFNEQTQQYIAQQCIRFDIDKDVLEAQTREINRLNGVINDLISRFDRIVEQLEEETEFLKDCTKYGNESGEQQEKSYSTMMMYEVADLVDDLIDIVRKGGVE